MTSLHRVHLKQLKSIGSVGVHRKDDLHLLDNRIIGDSYARIVLLMGPTGAGKSSVSLYHQMITAVLLIDTPGFADENISALEIVNKIRQWVKVNRFSYIFRILYFTPITSTRLPGTQKAVLSTFKALTGLGSGGGLTVVTTMWDTVWGPQAQNRAERNFEQLGCEIWKDFIKEKTKITKFENTPASALKILDLAMERNRYQYFRMESAFKDATKSSKTSFGANLHSDLVGRIHSLQMKKDVILSELAKLDIPENAELKAVLESELSQVNDTIAKFEQQLADFGPPPIPSQPLSADQTNPSGSHFSPQPPQSPPKSIVPAIEPHPEPKPEGRLSRIWGSTKNIVKRAAD